jgi:hypothetical protein
VAGFSGFFKKPAPLCTLLALESGLIPTTPLIDLATRDF